MKPVRTKAFLERGAAADVMRHTLSHIPTVFGRLVYLASVRSLTTGKYEHHGLALLYGEEEADGALRKCHSHAFEEWINFSLEQQKADLDLYLSALRQSRRSVLLTWLRLHPYEQLLPTHVRRATERRLYLADFETLMRLMSNECGVSSDPDA